MRICESISSGMAWQQAVLWVLTAMSNATDIYKATDGLCRLLDAEQQSDWAATLRSDMGRSATTGSEILPYLARSVRQMLQSHQDLSAEAKQKATALSQALREIGF